MRIAIVCAAALCCGLALADPTPLNLGNVEPETLRRWDRDATVTHRVLIDAPHTQLLTVETLVTNVEGDTLTFTLPTWRPGRYSVLDFAGKLQDVEALDARKGDLPVRKIDKTTWVVETKGQNQVRLRHRVYANELNLRARHVDDTHAFLSGSSVFMLVDGRRDTPQRVELSLPKTWKIACGLDQHPSRQDTLLSPNYDALVDSPLELGEQRRYPFEVAGVPHELIVWGETLPDPAKVVADLKLIAETQHAFWGTVPYGRYVWLLHVGPGLRGGTEHMNSTIMQITADRLKAGKNYRGFLGLCSHEFFHTWNVKRLRPAGIHPYHYTQENYTDLLWVSEGSTSYYDDLLLARSGQMKPKDYFKALCDSVEGFRKRPGREVQSLAMSSFDAWIKFNQPHDHSANSTVSFYRKGALVNLLLDMEIRRRSGYTKSLDDVFRIAFERYPLTGPGFTLADLQAVAEEVGGGSLDDFFRDYVHGVRPLPLEDAFLEVGLALTLASAEDEDEDEKGDDDEGEDDDDREAVTLGVDLSGSDGLARVTRVASDGPAFAAGVQVDDLLVAIDGRRVRTGKLEALLKRYEDGDEVALTLLRRDRLRSLAVTVVTEADLSFKLKRVETPSEQQKANYASWLGQPWPDDDEGDSEQPAASE